MVFLDRKIDLAKLWSAREVYLNNIRYAICMYSIKYVCECQDRRLLVVMPQMDIENRMVIDSEWEGVEALQLRTPDKRSRRLQRIIDEMEYRKLEEEE